VESNTRSRWSAFLAGVLLLVFLSASQPFTATPVYAATVNVDRTDDPAVTVSGVGAAACTGAGGDCSLRGAVLFANANAATTINIPAGLYQLTISGNAEQGRCTDPTVGDLDVTRSNTIIQGAGAGTNPAAATIIQQTMPTDRVVCVNPPLDPDFNFTMSGFTIAGGRETWNIGGGGLSAGGLRNNTTISNCLFVNNQTNGNSNPISANLGGGGLQIGGGSATVSNCTFGGANPPGASQTDLTLANSSTSGGGGMSYMAGDLTFPLEVDTATLNLTNSVFLNNVSTSGASGGGGLDLFNFNLGNGTFNVSDSTFTNNHANTAGGGGIIVETGILNALRNTFIGNTANTGGAIANTGTTVTATYNRFINNTATLSGNTLNNNGTGFIANDNWWGLNTGPAAGALGGTTSPTVTNWLQLKLTGTPTTLEVAQTSSLTASFLSDSANNVISPANLTALIGLPVTWGQTNGSLSGQQTTVQSSGTATATFTQGENCNNGSASATVDSGTVTQNFTTNCPNLKATKDHLPAGTIGLNVPWTWTIKVDNLGAAQATFQSGETILRDNLPSTNISYGSANIAAGSSGITGSGSISCGIASNTLTCSASGGTVVMAGTTGSFTAQFSATATVGGSYVNPTGGVCRSDPDTVVPETAEGDNDCSNTVSVLAPILAISKTHSGNFNQGDTGKTYTITVSNNPGAGPTNGTVTVSDTVPAGLTPTAAAGSGWSCGIVAQVMTCTRSDSLSGGSSYPAITLTVNVAINATGVTNTATVSGGGDPNPHSANDPTTINGVALLSITKTHSGNFTQGESGKTYTITVSNAVGSGSTSGAVSVSDTLPVGLTPVSASGAGWVCNIAAQVVGCTRNDALAGGSAYPAITLNVNVAANATSVTNTASVSGGGDPNPHSANDPTTILATAGLSITKTHVGNFIQGETGKTYSITVSNGPAGGATSGTVTVTDTLPAGLIPTAATGTGWGPSANACSIAGQAVTCSRSDALASGNSYPVITLTVNVANNATNVTNSVTVSGGGDPTPHTANDATTINPPAPTNGTFTVNKVFAPASGASVQISLTCTAGTVAVSPIAATMAAPAAFTVNAIGAGNTCTATEAVPAGYTANQAGCVNVALAAGGTANCTITNTQVVLPGAGTFTVNKVFAPASAASVQITLTCTSGTVAVSPLAATMAAPAVFTVNVIGAGNTCTASEAVPAGYTANQAPCVAQPLAAGGNASCTITNTQAVVPGAGTFTVSKVFSPATTTSVQIGLVCTVGTVTTSPLAATMAAPAVFTVSGIGAGNTCTATEVIPTGYTASQAQCAAVVLTGGGTASCTITNTLIGGGPAANPCAGLPANCQSATNPTVGGSATITNGGITATCQGPGPIAVARYTSNPVGPASFLATNFFDVKVGSASACTSVTIVDCDLAGANAIQWWNPAANGGGGGWQSVSNQTFNGGPPPCVTVVVNAGTSPSISQLSGTVFAGQVILLPGLVPIPQVFQNLGIIGAIQQGNRATPVRPQAQAPLASTPTAASAPPATMPVLRPPNTGDAGLPVTKALGSIGGRFLVGSNSNETSDPA
jgi:uncharacterized repeat protein (TIGR01451 family)